MVVETTFVIVDKTVVVESERVRTVVDVKLSTIVSTVVVSEKIGQLLKEVMVLGTWVVNVTKLGSKVTVAAVNTEQLGLHGVGQPQGEYGGRVTLRLEGQNPFGQCFSTCAAFAEIKIIPKSGKILCIVVYG